MDEVHIRYSAPRTLSRFLKSDAFVRVVEGPIGSGKSSACCLELVRRAQRQAPMPDGVRRTRFAVVRNTYRELKDTTRKTFEQWVPRQLGRWKEQDFTFNLRMPGLEHTTVESEIMFRALDRPDDVGKLLSLELTGAWLNETREIAKEIFDGLQMRVWRYPKKDDGGATWSGIWCDSNPWHTGHWLNKLFAGKPEGFELYRQPGGRSAEAENLENLQPDGETYYRRLMAGKDSDWIKVYIDGENASSDRGSVFGQWLEHLNSLGRVGLSLNEKPKAVSTAWDLGRADATAIWFWRLGPKRQGIEVLDWYQNHGKGLGHYFEELELRAESRGWKYEKHWLPHDAVHRTLATDQSVLNQAINRWGREAVAVVPKLEISDRIEAARWALEQDETRFDARCADGLTTLGEYRFEWDEELKCFSARPLHDWASHTGDAFGYLALVVKVHDMLTRPAPREARKPSGKVKDGKWDMTLDELYGGGR